MSDDVNAIVENEWVTGGFDPVGIVRNWSWWGSSRADSRGYRPAATVSFALDRAASGPTPYGFHVVNLAWNALCAGLLFALVRALGVGLVASSAAALVFAVLPIHSEAVVWVVGRAELGAAAGFLVAALSCLRFRRGGSPALLAAGAGCVALGMAFKENAITVLAMPVVFLVADRFGWRLRGPGASLAAQDHDADAPTPVKAGEPRPARRDGIALVALGAGAAVYALLRWSAAGAPTGAAPGIDPLDNPLSTVGLGTRLVAAVALLGRYVALVAWPRPLSVDYSWNALGIGPGFVANGDTAVAVLFLAACAAALARGPWRRDLVLVGLAMAAAAYSIVSNTVFVLGTIFGERLFYLPTAGLLVAAAAIADPWLAGDAWKRGAGRVATVAVALAVVAAVLVDRSRAAEWSTPVSLFEAAVSAYPDSARARMEYASALGGAGRIEESLRQFDAAIALKPDYTSAWYNRGNALVRANRYDEAAQAYRRTLAIDARFARAWHNLALTERILGNTDAWLDAMRGAAAISPGSAALQNELGEALLAAGRYQEAIGVYDGLIAGSGADAVAYFNRGVARHHLGGCAAAVEDYRLATRQAGAPREAFATASGCLRELGRSGEADEMDEAAKVANRDTRR